MDFPGNHVGLSEGIQLLVVFDASNVEPCCQLDNAPLRALMQQSVGDVMTPKDWISGTRGKLASSSLGNPDTTVLVLGNQDLHGRYSDDSLVFQLFGGRAWLIIIIPII